MDATIVSLVFLFQIIANVSTTIVNATPFESQEEMIYRINIVVDEKNSNFSRDSASVTLLMQGINKGREARGAKVLGLIFGIVVGILIILGILGFLIYLAMTRNRSSKEATVSITEGTSKATSSAR